MNRRAEVTVMSISEQEQRALRSIEDDLAGVVPELAAKLAIFERLTSGEEMPPGERLRRPARAPADRVPAAPSPAPAPSPGPFQVQRTLRMRVRWRLLWLVLTVALQAVAVTFGHGARKSSCPVPRAAACRPVHAPSPGHAAAGQGRR
jgi:hypothetical protein